ncbi:MAG: hypothetical protein canaca05_06440 [Anaerolineaceae bacterium]
MNTLFPIFHFSLLENMLNKLKTKRIAKAKSLTANVRLLQAKYKNTLIAILD